jgi:dipeptidyl aminopeptidase/acylaminoacyl peptidase
MQSAIFRCAAAGVAAVATLLAFPAVAPAQPDEVTLELIMSDPDWMGNAPQFVYWADDSGSVFFLRKREGSQIRDLYEASLDGQVRLVPDAERPAADVRGGDWSGDRSMKVYEREGDIYLKDMATGAIRQLTRTNGRESNPMFLIGDGRIAYSRDREMYIRDLETGLEFQPADIRFEQDPDEKREADEKKEGYLEDQQERLFEIIRERDEREEEERAREDELREADPMRAPEPWWMGDKHQLAGAELAPTGSHMFITMRPKNVADGKNDNMPEWVTETGYVINRSVRELVGTGDRAAMSAALLNLTGRERIDIDLSTLPLIDDDPLAEIKAATEARKKATADDEAGADATEAETDDADGNGDDEEAEEKKPAKPRDVSIFNVEWSDDGAFVAFQARSTDNKDRWTCIVEAATGEMTCVEHLRDEAWINWRFNDLGWLEGTNALWFLSEAPGYSHLFISDMPTAAVRQVTSGEFEIDSVTPLRDGSAFIVRANREHPGVHEVYRVDRAGGAMTRLTDFNGQVDSMTLSPDESTLAMLASSTTRPEELFVQAAAPNGQAAQLTDTASERFLSTDWAEPEVVAIPSSNVDAPIWSRIYTPADDAPGAGSDGRRPAVMFVHGAGYLQNAHKGWSGYFREFMFHTLLTRLGYVVIDMDYRASAGYGRDWRTAIYRRMGTPELEDFHDGVAWLAEHRNVDPGRVGVYGGSYGGFMTFMALFRSPDLFAAGASLRPVTDWAHYNHGYTSNILNTPEIDPEAYERSSPIEFAEGLTKPMLICHGMLDDNVFFKDSVRLVQRLIELEKEDWEIAIYPIEPHGFREPSSWLDEYRRIFKLFETNLK